MSAVAQLRFMTQRTEGMYPRLPWWPSLQRRQQAGTGETSSRLTAGLLSLFVELNTWNVNKAMKVGWIKEINRLSHTKWWNRKEPLFCFFIFCWWRGCNGSRFKTNYRLKWTKYCIRLILPLEKLNNSMHINKNVKRFFSLMKAGVCNIGVTEAPTAATLPSGV